MSDVGAPLRLPPSAGPGAAASGNTGRVVNPPSAALQLGGETLPGTVAGRTPQGQLLIRGDFGQIAVATPLRLPSGTAVTLTFRPHVSGLFVTILPRAAGEPGRPAGAVGPSASRAPDGAAAAPVPGRQPDSQGSGQGQGRQSGQQPGQGQHQGRAQGGPGGAEAARPQGSGAPAGSMLPGVIVGRDGQDRLLLRGGFGQIALDTPTRLAPGTRILLQFAQGTGGPVATLFAEPGQDAPRNAPQNTAQGASQGPAAGRAGVHHLHPLAFGAVSASAPGAALHPGGAPAPLARVWPSLTALAEAFAGPESAPLQALLPAGFPPKVGGRLALSLLRFVQAAQGDGLLAWLGDPARAALAAGGRGPTPQRLQEADDELRWLARDPPGDWRLVLLPLLGAGPPEALRLFLKKRGGQGEGDAPAPTHFLCDLSLSRLGALQVEGLLREARFDLVLRSRRPLAPALRDELTGIFAAASEAGGLAGGFRFQAGDNWQPLPVPQPAGRPEALSV